MSVVGRHPLVRADVSEAINRYEDQQPGLGLEFAADFRFHYRQFARDARLYAVRFADVRRINLARFSPLKRSWATPSQITTRKDC